MIKNLSHCVIKLHNIELYCDPDDILNLAVICNKVLKGRAASGKEADPTYLVINTDEPYAEEVAEFIRRHET